MLDFPNDIVCVYLLPATSEGCLLQLCYEFFTQPVTDDPRLMHKIRKQLVHLVSNLSVVEGGPNILFESSCHCCTEASSCVCVSECV